MVTPTHACEITQPTPFSRKNSEYSRPAPLRALWRNVQWRFMKYELVAATAIAIPFDVSGPQPMRRCSRFESPKWTAVLITPTRPNFATSWTSTWNRWYSLVWESFLSAALTRTSPDAEGLPRPPSPGPRRGPAGPNRTQGLRAARLEHRRARAPPHGPRAPAAGRRAPAPRRRRPGRPADPS